MMSEITVRCGEFEGENMTALLFIDVLSDIDELLEEDDYEEWIEVFYTPISEQIEAHNSKETMDAIEAAVDLDDVDKYEEAMAHFVQPEITISQELATYLRPLAAEYMDLLAADLEELTGGEELDPDDDELDEVIGFEVMKFWCARDLVSALEVCIETGDPVIIDAAPSEIDEVHFKDTRD